MKMNIFSDIDDTLTASFRHRQESIAQRLVSESPSPKAIYSSQEQDHLQQMIFASGANLIPVSGRTIESINSLKINWNSYRIGSFGARITTPCGGEHSQYNEPIIAQLDSFQKRLFQTFYATSDLLDTLHCKIKIVPEYDRPCYIKILIRDTAYHSEAAKAVNAFITIDNMFRVVVAKGSLFIIPSFISKRNAVKSLKDHIGSLHTSIGIGDNAADLEYLDLCDFSMMPKHSSLFEMLRNN